MTTDGFLTDHWPWRPGWSESSRYLTWHLLPTQAVELHVRVAEHRQALTEFDGLDLVPVRWLHLTVQGVGFTEEVGSVATDAVVAGARRRLALLAPIDLTFATAGVGGEGVRLEGVPAGRVQPLRTELRAAIADVLGPAAVPGRDDESLEPHVSVAYANASVPISAVRAAIDRVPTKPVSVRFSSISLIELRRSEHQYRWEVVADVPLGGHQERATVD